MAIPEFILWYSANFLLLFAGAGALLLLKRKLQGREIFTDEDWRILFGIPKEKLTTRAFWRRAALTGFIAVAVGFNIGVIVLIHGIGWFSTAWAVTAAIVVFLLPSFLK